MNSIHLVGAWEIQKFLIDVDYLELKTMKIFLFLLRQLDLVMYSQDSEIRPRIFPDIFKVKILYRS